MIPLDSPHAWDSHGRAWEVIHSRGTPSLPTGCPTATRGDSAATTNDAQNTTTRPSPRAPRHQHVFPEMPHVFPATQRIVSYRVSYHATRVQIDGKKEVPKGVITAY